MHEELVRQAQRGDAEAFDALARTVGDRCLAIAVRILRDVDLAEDAVQSALITAWTELRALRDPSRFEPWLHRILTNACFAEARRRKRWYEGPRILPVAGAYGPDDYLTVDDRDTSVVYASFRVGGRATIDRVMTRRERDEVTAVMTPWGVDARFTSPDLFPFLRK